MRTMYDLCDGKIWRAVEAMIDGLKTQSERPDFVVDMDSFGRVNNHPITREPVCFGCAATCTVQQLVGVNFDTNNVLQSCHTVKVDVMHLDLVRFECVIEALRNGHLGPIFDYFKKDRQLVQHRNLPVLRSYNWRENLQPYKELLHDLKAFDL